MAINTPAPDFVPDTASGAFGQAIVSVLDLVVMVLPFALFLLRHLVFIGLVYVFERVSSRSIHPPILMSESHHAHVDVKKNCRPRSCSNKILLKFGPNRSFIPPPACCSRALIFTVPAVPLASLQYNGSATLSFLENSERMVREQLEGRGQ